MRDDGRVDGDLMLQSASGGDTARMRHARAEWSGCYCSVICLSFLCYNDLNSYRAYLIFIPYFVVQILYKVDISVFQSYMLYDHSSGV